MNNNIEVIQSMCSNFCKLTIHMHVIFILSKNEVQVHVIWKLDFSHNNHFTNLLLEKFYTEDLLKWELFDGFVYFFYNSSEDWSKRLREEEKCQDYFRKDKSYIYSTTMGELSFLALVPRSFPCLFKKDS